MPPNVDFCFCGLAISDRICNVKGCQTIASPNYQSRYEEQDLIHSTANIFHLCQGACCGFAKGCTMGRMIPSSSKQIPEDWKLPSGAKLILLVATYVPQE
ncbi:hypothetical protein NL676_003112 [Syzygium grande]|nr:hypothetical protein NL676_003112 [Syzygium grande]